MNKHLAYLFTALGESIVLYIILYFIEKRSNEITGDHITMILVTNFVSVYSGFYLLPLFSSI